MCHNCILQAEINKWITQICYYFFILMCVGAILVSLLNIIELFSGPLWPQLVHLWRHWRARYRVRSRMVALLKKCELQNWQRYLEENSGLQGFWLTLPSFLLDQCHPKRDEYRGGYLLAVDVMDQDFDTQFVSEIQEEYKRLYP